MISINKTGLVRVWFTHQHRLNFLGLPKTGSSTVRELLGVRVQDWHDLPSDKVDDYLCFTVVRDPVARAVSSYNETLIRGTFKGDFDQFLTRLDYFGTFDEHTLPQTWYLDEAKKAGIVPDVYLLCNQNLVANLGALCGAEFEPIYLNKGRETVHLTKAHRKFIKELYKTDFRLYEQVRAEKEVQKESANTNAKR